MKALLSRWREPFAFLQRLTIREVLLFTTAGLALMIAILAGRDLYSNATRLTQAYELRAAIEVSDHLFDAIGEIAVERDLGTAILQATDEETASSLAAPLAEARVRADRSVAAAFAALGEFQSSGLGEMEAELRARHARIQRLRPQLDAALHGARRDPALAPLWRDTATELMSDAERLWLGFIGPFTLIDPVVTQHLRYRHNLRTITDYTGRERSLIAELLSQNAPPRPAQTAELLRAQGVLSHSWRLTRVIAEQSGLYAVIEPHYIDAESHYATLGDMTREMFYTLGSTSVSYPIGPDFWFELSSQAADSLTALREASRAATQAYLDDMIDDAEGAIVTQALISLLALLLAGASFWWILTRVVRPIRDIVDALTRATRGEPANFAMTKVREDEIGKLANVLDAFQGNVEQMRRNAAELDASARALEGEVVVRRSAEEKAQAQLERLNLLHQISRAIGERQELDSILDVALASVEERLPADFACVLLRADGAHDLRVARVGRRSERAADVMGMSEGSAIAIGENGLSRCMRGRLVYEPEFENSTFDFPRRLQRSGLRSFVAAPLQVESQVFGALVIARLDMEAFSSGECEFLRQLSEHVALAANQAQLNAALQQAYDDLRQTQAAVMQQERLRALGQMASGVAHDINNALSPIALYTESLLTTEPALTDAGRNKLEIVQRAIDDAARTIARMNDFYRQRDKQLQLEPIEANRLVQQVLDLTQARWRDMAQQRGDTIEMQPEFAPGLAPVLGVESELREALTNLVFNAIDALPAGGGRVIVRTKAAAARSGFGVEIEIEDNGVGMDEATRQRCLEPFFTTKGERGTGLGLAMVYGAIQRHGGDIAIESELGEGTLVRLKLAGAAQDAGMRGEAFEARPNARLRVLIIDDDPILLRSLRDVLESDGHAVESANSGAIGLDLFAAAREQSSAFDAVITDLGMPGMDGRRVAAAIKQLSSMTPVILLTGWGERLRSEEEHIPHIDCILSKPPKLGEVRNALATLSGCVAPQRASTGQ